MDFSIIMDSCGEMTEEMKADPRITSAPLTMEVAGVSYIDDASFRQAEFLKAVAESKEAPKSSCPSPEVYMKAFLTGGAHCYAVTLSAALSGSFNSAMLGRNLALDKQPDKRIYVFNSRSASVGETLIAKKISELEEAGQPFEEVVRQTEAYIEGQNTFFVLENLDTLRKNGRLSNLKALFATALKIKPILCATKDGEITQLDQARGINKALIKMVDGFVARAVQAKDKILAISHCNCPERARMVVEAIRLRMEVKDVILLDTGGISSMYANEGGVIAVL